MYSKYGVKSKAIFNIYCKMSNLYWSSDILSFISDKKDWIELDKLNPKLKRQCTNALIFFRFADDLVLENLTFCITPAFDDKDIQSAYEIQIAQERVHSIVYEQIVEALLGVKYLDLNEGQKIPEIKNISDSMNRIIKDHDDTKNNLKLRLLMFAAYEGILFSAAFAVIQQLKELNICIGLTQANEYISRDENIHCQLACEIILSKNLKLDTSVIYEIIDEIVILSYELIGEEYKPYVQYTANKLCSYLNIDLVYDQILCPLQYMHKLELGGTRKANFFERKTTEYSKLINNGIIYNVEEKSVISLVY